MKKILLIMVLTLGISTVYSQGLLGQTEQQIKTFCNKNNYTVTRTIEEYDLIMITADNPYDQWVFLIHPTENYVINSTIHFKSKMMMETFIQGFNEDFVQLNPVTWINYYKDGACTIKLTPAVENYWPYMIFTYEAY